MPRWHATNTLDRVADTIKHVINPVAHASLVHNRRLPSATSSAMNLTHSTSCKSTYHQPGPVPYRGSAGTVTYGRALMGRASRENISCRGLRWDIFPLCSDYGGSSMAWVGLLAWAIYMALTPPSMAWRGPRSVGEIQSSRMIKIREFFHAM